MNAKRTGFIATMIFCCLFMASTNVLAQDNYNGTVTIGDKVWLKNAGCIGLKTWTEAGNAVSALKGGHCGMTDTYHNGSWRLPTQDELLTVFASKNMFTNVQNSYYWTQSMGGTGSSPYFCHSGSGTCLPTAKTSIGYVWPVRNR